MRTKTINVYTFAELYSTAKARAIHDYQAIFGFPHDDEYFASLNKLAEHFGAKLSRYEIDWFNCSHSSAKFEFDDDEMSQEEIAARLKELGSYNPETLAGHGDCKLTGYCADEDAIDGFRVKFMAYGPASLAECMEAAFRSWLTAGQSDCEGFYEDDEFADHCEANDYEFYDDGSGV